MDDNGESPVEEFRVYEPTNGVPWQWCIDLSLANEERINEIEKWCTDTFGPSNEGMHFIDNNATWHSQVLYGEIYLRSDAEVTLFRLRWSS